MFSEENGMFEGENEWGICINPDGTIYVESIGMLAVANPEQLRADSDGNMMLFNYDGVPFMWFRVGEEPLLIPDDALSDEDKEFFRKQFEEWRAMDEGLDYEMQE